ncbi:hypothetical protein WA158_007392 [Blastocystis sp. Blastoise]
MQSVYKSPIISYNEINYIWYRKTSNVNIIPNIENIVTEWVINPTLPSGLIFNNENGIISGIPLIYKSLNNYTITAYNEDKSNSTIISITILNKICDATEDGYEETTSGNSFSIPCENNELYEGSITRECIDNDNSYWSTETDSCIRMKCPENIYNDKTYESIPTNTSISISCGDGFIGTYERFCNLDKTWSEPIDHCTSTNVVCIPSITEINIVRLQPVPEYSISCNSEIIESYSINSELPSGLIFNSETGIISGIPTTTLIPSNKFIISVNSPLIGGYEMNIVINELYCNVDGDWNFAIGGTTVTHECDSFKEGSITRVCNNVYPATWEDEENTCKYKIPIINYENNNYIWYRKTSNINIMPIIENYVSSYSISPELPSGLIFNNENGSISGIPLIYSDITEYTITAYNEDKSNNVIISITILNKICDATEDGKYEESVAGTKIELLCPENELYNGIISRECIDNDNSYWSEIINTCTRNTCNSITEDDVIWDITPTNTTVTKSCDEGLEGSITKKCNLDGTWSNTINTCGLPSIDCTIDISEITIVRLQPIPTYTITCNKPITTFTINPIISDIETLSFNSETGIISGYYSSIMSKQIYTIQPVGYIGSISLSITINELYCNVDGEWSETVAGTIATHECDSFKEGSITRLCNNEYPASWSESIINTCVYKSPIISYNEINYIWYRKTSNVNIIPNIENIVTEWVINPTLPSGLIFNNENGIISGIPLIYKSLNNYTITAYNEDKSNSTIISITILNKICDATEDGYEETSSGNSFSIPCENNELYEGSITRECIDNDNSYWSTETDSCIRMKCPENIYNDKTYESIPTNTSISISCGDGFIGTYERFCNLDKTWSEPIDHCTSTNVVCIPSITEINIVRLQPVPEYSISCNSEIIESYSINSELPSGLIFNSETGIISGIPTTTLIPSNKFIISVNSPLIGGYEMNIVINELYCNVDGDWNFAIGGTTSTHECDSFKEGSITRVCNNIYPATWEDEENTCKYKIPIINYDESSYIWYRKTSNVNIMPIIENYVSSYSISPELPSGLIFNNENGSISGIPLIYSTITEYTITAYNEDKSNNVIISITILNKICDASEDGKYEESVAGTKIELLCPENELYNGLISRECIDNDNSYWSEIINTCTRNTCNSITEDDVIWDITPTNTTSTKSCDEGLEGSITKKCNLDGTWSNTINTCGLPSIDCTIDISEITIVRLQPIPTYTITCNKPITTFTINPIISDIETLSFNSETGIISGYYSSIMSKQIYTIQPVGYIGSISLSITINELYCNVDGEWSETVAGTIATHECDSLKEGSITRLCNNEYPASWSESIINTCVYKSPIISYNEINYIWYRKTSNVNIIPNIENIVTEWVINPTLPSGLIFNNENGIISGIPLIYKSLNNYTITAYNEDKSNSTIISITILNKICDATEDGYEETSSGNSFSIPCENNELYEGSITRECIDNDNSYWSTETDSCIRMKCPENIYDGKTYESIPTNTSISISCGDGFIGTYERFCNLDKTWSEPIDHCTSTNVVCIPSITEINIVRLQPVPEYSISCNSEIIESYSINSELPSGLVFNSETGIISGIPTTTLIPSTKFIISVNSPLIGGYEMNVIINELYCNVDGDWNFAIGGTTSTHECDSFKEGSITRVCNNIYPATWEDEENTCKYKIPIINYDESSYIWYRKTSNVNIMPIIENYVSSYSISPELPSGLIFNNENGSISGIPLIYSTITEYTITAYNEDKSNNVIISITILNKICDASEDGKYEESVAGTKIELLCPENELYNGLISRECIDNDNSYWSEIINTCTRNTCNSITEDDVIWDITPTNTTSTKSCDEGLEGSITKKCNLDGTWSNTINTCGLPSIDCTIDISEITIVRLQPIPTYTITCNKPITTFTINPIISDIETLSFNSETGIISGYYSSIMSKQIYTIQPVGYIGSISLSITINELYCNVDGEWSETVAGTIATHECDSLKEGSITRLCNNEYPASWSESIINTCVYKSPIISYNEINYIWYRKTSNVNIIPNIENIVTEWVINPTLPSGLIFNNENGIISGIPLIYKSLNNYTITAYNEDKSNSTIISITILNKICDATEDGYEETSSGNSFSIPCENNELYEGSITRECIDNDNSYWSTETDSCIRMKCPENIYDGKTYESIPTNTSISISCGDGFIGTYERFCNLDKTWSEPIDHCTSTNVVCIPSITEINIVRLQPVPEYSISCNSEIIESYSINSELPSGLVFNSETGIISGIPTTTLIPSTKFIISVNSPLIGGYEMNVIINELYCNVDGDWNFAIGGTTSTHECDSFKEGSITRVCNNIYPATWEDEENTCKYKIPIINYDESSYIWYRKTSNVNIMPIIENYVSSYSISPELPSGLIFNNENGSISGIPLIYSSITEYTITAINEDKSGSVIIAITILNKICDATEDGKYEESVAGTKIELSCPESELYSGLISRECIDNDNSYWSEITNTCTRNTCNSIIEDDVIWDITPTNTTSTKSCDEGLEGSITKKCNLDGTWSNTINTCSIKQCMTDIDSVYNLEWNSIDINTSMSISCSTPYEGVYMRKCNSEGIWESVENHCYIPTVSCIPSQNIFSISRLESMPIYDIPCSKPIQSFTISPLLPNGLSFDTHTAIISGSSTTILDTTIYTISLSEPYNDSFTISITINELYCESDGMWPKTIAGEESIINCNDPMYYIGNSHRICNNVYPATWGSIIEDSCELRAPYDVSYPQNQISIPINTPMTPLIPTYKGLNVEFSITPSLPSNLIFDIHTGMISGTPTVIIPLSSYTITLRNEGGSIDIIISIVSSSTYCNSIEENGYIFPDTSVGGSVSLKCEDGYSGSIIRNCLSDKLWSPIINTCKQIYCPSKIVNYHELEFSIPETPAGHKSGMHCYEGGIWLSCSISGEWDETIENNCTECNSGQYPVYINPDDGTKVCDTCPSGMICPDGSIETMTGCYGQYWSTSGSKICQLCINGYTNKLLNGNTMCTECKSDEYVYESECIKKTSCSSIIDEDGIWPETLVGYRASLYINNDINIGYITKNCISTINGPQFEQTDYSGLVDKNIQAGHSLIDVNYIFNNLAIYDYDSDAEFLISQSVIRSFAYKLGSIRDYAYSYTFENGIFTVTLHFRFESNYISLTTLEKYIPVSVNSIIDNLHSTNPYLFHNYIYISVPSIIDSKSLNDICEYDDLSSVSLTEYHYESCPSGYTGIISERCLQRHYDSYNTRRQHQCKPINPPFGSDLTYIDITYSASDIFMQEFTCEIKILLKRYILQTTKQLYYSMDVYNFHEYNNDNLDVKTSFTIRASVPTSYTDTTVDILSSLEDPLKSFFIKNKGIIYSDTTISLEPNSIHIVNANKRRLRSL